MKKMLYLFFILASSKLSGQLDSMLVKATPTSLEEYNYLVKGYKIQIESGLDMKSGYHFEEIGEHDIGGYHFKIKNLIRDSANELAGILIITESSTSGIIYYTGIPINNPKLMNKYAQEISKWHGGMQAAYSYLVAAYLSSSFYGMHKMQ